MKVNNIIIDKNNLCFKMLENNENVDHITGVINGLDFNRDRNLLILKLIDKRKKYANINILNIIYLSLDKRVNINLLNLLISVLYEKIDQLQCITIIITNKIVNNQNNLFYFVKNKNTVYKKYLKTETLIEMLQKEEQILEIIHILNTKINNKK